MDDHVPSHCPTTQEEIEELLQSGDRWLGITLEAHRRSRFALHTKDPLTVQREGMSLLLAGTNEGHLALLDHTTGAVKSSMKVHVYICTSQCVCTCCSILSSSPLSTTAAGMAGSSRSCDSACLQSKGESSHLCLQWSVSDTNTQI